MPFIGTPTRMFCTIRTKATNAVKIPPVAGTASGFRIFSNETTVRDHQRRASAQGAPDCTARMRMRTARSAGDEVFPHHRVLPRRNGSIEISRQIAFGLAAIHRSPRNDRAATFAASGETDGADVVTDGDGC